MTDLAVLQREASRADYRSMARLARALHEAGQPARAVLRTCYGVDFPDELFAIADARAHARPPHVDFTNQPWELAIPLEHGGPALEPDGMDDIEQRVLALDPQLLAVMALLDPDSAHGHSILCYRLDELAAGRSTVIGLRSFFYRDAVADPVRYGDSLVTVMLEHFTEHARRRQRELDSPANRGAGALDERHASDARGGLARIEEIVRQLTGGSGSR
jgi:hypothetical protein